jgi:hypothetical protein
MMHCGAARLRHDVQAEAVLRHAAEAADDPPRTTAEAAKRALALKADSTPSPREPAASPAPDVLSARLRLDTSVATAHHASLLRAWAQGP